VKPWATIFIAAYSRAITGYAIAVTPSQESVLSALRSAIMVEEPHGQFGGVPGAIRFDQGKELLATAVRTAAGELAIDVRPQPSYTPHLKGTIERPNESIEQLFPAELPGFLHGATDRAGRAIDPNAPLLPPERLSQLFDEFVTRYKDVRPHEELDGRTPGEQWEADPTPLHTVAAERLRHLMLDQLNVILGPGLNAVIGGKGTGKSTRYRNRTAHAALTLAGGDYRRGLVTSVRSSVCN
jgi:putative transposase